MIELDPVRFGFTAIRSSADFNTGIHDLAKIYDCGTVPIDCEGTCVHDHSLICRTGYLFDRVISVFKCALIVREQIHIPEPYPGACLV